MSSEQAELPFGGVGSTDNYSESSSSEALSTPETPPEELLVKPLPRVDGREEIAPDNDACSIRTGDLVVSYVGASEMQWYGMLILDTYGRSTLIGLALPAYQYGDRDLDEWVGWVEEHAAENHTTVYKDVAPQTRQENA